MGLSNPSCSEICYQCSTFQHILLSLRFFYFTTNSSRHARAVHSPELLCLSRLRQCFCLVTVTTVRDRKCCDRLSNKPHGSSLIIVTLFAFLHRMFFRFSPNPFRAWCAMHERAPPFCSKANPFDNCPSLFFCCCKRWPWPGRSARHLATGGRHLATELVPGPRRAAAAAAKRKCHRWRQGWLGEGRPPSADDSNSPRLDPADHCAVSPRQTHSSANYTHRHRAPSNEK